MGDWAKIFLYLALFWWKCEATCGSIVESIKNFKVGVFFFVKRDDFFALPAWYVLLPIQARRAITRGCEKWEEEA